MYEIAADVAAERERTAVPFRVLINPKYTGVGEDRRSFYEGCLSVPGYQGVVTRSARVHVKYTDIAGASVEEEFAGWPARIVAHETDHLDGIVYIDRVETRSLAANDVYSELWADPSPARAAAALGFEAPRR
jgi:peptide deformylase